MSQPLPTQYTRAAYAKLLAGFREAPGNYHAAARYAGCGWRMAKRAWLEGWPKYAWARPIREVLVEEEAAARAAVAARLQTERTVADAESEKARLAAVETAMQEIQIMTAARKTVVAAFGLAAKLVRPLDALAQHLGKLVFEADGHTPRSAADLKAEGLDAEATVRLLGRYTLVLQRAMAVGSEVVKLRLLTEGKPTGIIKELVEMSPEAAAEELEEQEEAIRLVRAEAAQRRKDVH